MTTERLKDQINPTVVMLMAELIQAQLKQKQLMQMQQLVPHLANAKQSTQQPAQLTHSVIHSGFNPTKGFDPEAFVAAVVTPDFEQLSLMARVQHIATQLGHFLPADFSQACQILFPVSAEFSGLVGFIFPEFVSQFGLAQPDIALPALAHFTQFSTSEFAIRPFLQAYPELTLAQMNCWAESENVHLRRLASEGCRPRLPWGKALPAFIADPRPVLQILHKLKADPADYVRRSVANNLNDISKDHPELALDIAASWVGQSPHTDWIVKHALRGLLKKRHPQALQLFGYQPLTTQAQLTLATSQLRLGETLHFTAQLDFPVNPGKVRIEFAIDFASANGKLRHKVFQWSEREINEPSWQQSRSYRFIDLTTRKHYCGAHRLHLIVNGQILTSSDFVLMKRNESTAIVTN